MKIEVRHGTWLLLGAFALGLGAVALYRSDQPSSPDAATEAEEAAQGEADGSVKRRARRGSSGDGWADGPVLGGGRTTLKGAPGLVAGKRQQGADLVVETDEGTEGVGLDGGSGASGGGGVVTGGLLTHVIDEMGPVKVGEKMPSWAGFTDKNVMVRSNDLLHPRRSPEPSALVIYFFGTYCKPCKVGLPILQRVMVENPQAKAVLIAKPPQLSTVHPFLKSLRVNQQWLPDPHEKIAGRLGVKIAIPRTIVVGHDGVVRAIFGIEGSDYAALLRDAVLGEEAP